MLHAEWGIFISQGVRNMCPRLFINYWIVTNILVTLVVSCTCVAKSIHLGHPDWRMQRSVVVVYCYSFLALLLLLASCCRARRWDAAHLHVSALIDLWCGCALAASRHAQILSRFR
jgi:hypothetical protein